MSHPIPGWTPSQVRGLADDGRRYEVVAGDLLVTPAPGRAHQRAVGLLLIALDQYLRGVGGYEVLCSPADVELDERTLVQPDLFVTRLTPGAPDDWSHLDLCLAIEVLSPSTARADRHIKRTLFQRHGIEYWIVDQGARAIERWVPGDQRPELLATELAWRPPGAVSHLVLPLNSFFASIMDRG